MNITLLEWLEGNVDGGAVFVWGIVAMLILCLLWWLFLGDLLHKCNVSSLGYKLYEAGPIGTFGILLFLKFFIVLLITSIQASFIHGAKMIFPLLVFWGIIVAAVIFIAKHKK